MKVFQGEGRNIKYSSLHAVALKNRLINHPMATIGALPLLWSGPALGSQVVLCVSAGGWLHAAALYTTCTHFYISLGPTAEEQQRYAQRGLEKNVYVNLLSV